MNTLITEDLGFTRKQVIATVSEACQQAETWLALWIARGLMQDAKNVLFLSPWSKRDYLKSFSQLLSAEAVFALEECKSLLWAENPRQWHDFDQEFTRLLQKVQPSLILIESPDIVLPCQSAWEYVLQKRQLHDPWGGLARRVKAMSEQAGCPIWVFGELCYSLKFLDHLYSDHLPQSEASWRSCAQLEAYLSYWDCVIEVLGGSSQEIQLQALKNRLGSHFGPHVLRLEHAAV